MTSTLAMGNEWQIHKRKDITIDIKETNIYAITAYMISTLDTTM